jgi:predicted Rossmann-fold nucleotide-binding protein
MEVMKEHGTISEADMKLVTLVDDVDEVIQIVDKSLYRQLDAIKEMGLEESSYGEMLKETQNIRGKESNIALS